MTVTTNQALDFLATLPPTRNAYPARAIAQWRSICFVGEYNRPLALEQARQFGVELSDTMTIQEQLRLAVYQERIGYQESTSMIAARFYTSLEIVRRTLKAIAKSDFRTQTGKKLVYYYMEVNPKQGFKSDGKQVQHLLWAIEDVEADG